jgi:hypothetical protein
MRLRKHKLRSQQDQAETSPGQALATAKAKKVAARRGTLLRFNKSTHNQTAKSTALDFNVENGNETHQFDEQHAERKDMDKISDKSHE